MPEPVATPMELFLLTLVGQGVNTMYALQKQAHLSPGGIRPVVSRLEEGRLIKRGGKGPRRRRTMELTGEGCKLLKAAFTIAMADAGSWDLEAVLRVIWAAAQFSPKTRKSVIEQIANQRSERAAELQSQASDFQVKMRNPIATYDWMVAFCKWQQLQIEAEAIRQVGRQLEKKPDNADFNPPDFVRKSRGEDL